MNENQAPAPVGVSPEHEKALRKAIGDFHGFLMRYFGKRTDSLDEVYDLIAQFWISTYQRFSIEQYRHPALIRFRANQVWIDHERKKAVRGFVKYTSNVPDVADTTTVKEIPPEKEEEFKAEFWHDNFAGLVLNETHKEAFWLKEVKGFTLEALSVKMNVPKSTVNDWITNLKSRCREHLKGAAK